ncbi:MAG: aspartate ammonia-lyase [Candidatus Cloacimonadales bacterium]
MRIEKDFLGELELNDACYYGIQTARARTNFAVSGYKIEPLLIKSLAYVKLACAETNQKLGYLEPDIAGAIAAGCREIIAGKYQEQFVVDPLQGGAGTSFNMNINEVIANLALEKLGLPKGDYARIDPLGHVNMHQSTNDVFPTAVKLAVLFYLQDLEKATAHLQATLQQKEQEFQNVIKLGRTQLQDAVPMTLGMTFAAYSEAISRDRWRIFKCRERIKTINLGGTAIGTGLGAPQQYIFKVAQRLRRLTGLAISRSENMIDSTQNLDSFVEVSGMLKAFASNLLKISGDLRLLSSGPQGGWSEINLPAVQKGSSIMPGKVNPVIPEMVSQVALKIMANDSTIGLVAGLGNLELNQFTPLLAHSILDSLKLLNNAVQIFQQRCLQGITANSENCQLHLKKSKMLATVLVPILGYHLVEEILASATARNCEIEKIILERKLLSAEELQKLLSPNAMYKMGF